MDPMATPFNGGSPIYYLDAFSQTITKALNGTPTKLCHFPSQNILLLADLTDSSLPCLVAYMKTDQGCQIYHLPLTEEYVEKHVDYLGVTLHASDSDVDKFTVYGTILGAAFKELDNAVLSQTAHLPPQQQQLQVSVSYKSFYDDRDSTFALELVQDGAHELVWRSMLAVYLSKYVPPPAAPAVDAPSVDTSGGASVTKKAKVGKSQGGTSVFVR